MDSSWLPRVVPARPGTGARRAGDDYGVSDTPDWRGVDWPSVQHTVRVEGADVNYVDMGEQGEHRPVLFIHGLGGQWQNFLENVPHFAQGRRVIAPDLPGFGASAMPSSKLTISWYAKVVAALCDHLDLGAFVVVGNSMGGYIAAELAIERPELVERLMLISSAGVSQMNLATEPTVAVAKVIALGTAMDMARLRLVARRPRMRDAALALVVRYPETLRADLAFEGLMSGTGRAGFVDGLRACLEYDFRERLPQIACPTLVVWGEKDMVIPVADADQFGGRIGGARKVIFADTGHMPMIERPVTFNKLLAEFLEYRVSEGELEGEEGWEERARARNGGANGSAPAGGPTDADSLEGVSR